MNNGHQVYNDSPAVVGENVESSTIATCSDNNHQSIMASGVADCSTITLREIQFSPSKTVSLVIPVKIRGVHTQAVIDTAAQVSIISEELAEKITPPFQVKEKVILRGAEKSSNMIAKRIAGVPLSIGQHDYTWDLLIAPIADPFILGLDFLKSQRGVIDLADDLLLYSMGTKSMQK